MATPITVGTGPFFPAIRHEGREFVLDRHRFETEDQAAERAKITTDEIERETIRVLALAGYNSQGA